MAEIMDHENDIDSAEELVKMEDSAQEQAKAVKQYKAEQKDEIINKKAKYGMQPYQVVCHLTRIHS